MGGSTVFVGKRVKVAGRVNWVVPAGMTVAVIVIGTNVTVVVGRP